MCQLVNSANREMGLNYNLISGPLGPDNFVECTEVVFSVHSPTCAGYVVAFDSLPNKVGELFASCVDTSTTGQHTFSINSETREIFANEESGHDSNMCGFQSNPCSSIHFSARASSRSAFSISAVGNFTAPAHPVILASPCMHLTSGPSAEETRACLNFSLYAVPKLRAPNNRLELSHLNFVLTTDQNDGAFFRAGQSSTHIRDILMFYPGKLHISLFFLPHTSTSKIVIDLDAHDLSFSHFKFCQVETDTLIVVDETSVLSVFSSTFPSCRGREAGVVLFTDKADTVNPFTGVDLVSNRYTHKEGIGHVMTSRFGNDVTIRNKALLFAITNVRSSSIFPRVVVGDSEHAEAIDLFAPKPSVFHLDISGTDSHKCGMKTLPCCTLQYTIGVTNETNKKLEMASHRPDSPFSAPKEGGRVMTIDSGDIVSSSHSNIQFDECTVSVFIPSPTISSLSSSVRSLFSISSGSLFVSRLHTFNVQAVPHSSTLLSLHRTDFKIENTTLTSLITRSQSGLM
ncbi:hypothetical protein BLNAU_1272 [Blattamonas nauphoetae]|uniref:Uncharacterized protein n=1 Tax=Blattamonas nauphoetae TaxID=2049346 RepID=A0ABQ9YIW8_9EUKA|nr:hypothetical protein BLNAU_1272 [Blattamonas nauphoetae]